MRLVRVILDWVMDQLHGLEPSGHLTTSHSQNLRSVSSVEVVPSTMASLVGRVIVWWSGAKIALGGLLARAAGNKVTLATTIS